MTALPRALPPRAAVLLLLLIALVGAGSCGKKHRNVTAPTTSGSPTDTDGDGVPDSQDACPTVAGPSAFGGCPSPTADVCSGAAPYTLAGYHWSTLNPVYAYSSSLPTGWRPAVDAAAGTWSGAGSSLRIGKSATVVSAGVAQDGKNVVSYGSLPSGVLGTTYSWYNTNTHVLTEADIVLSTATSMTLGGSPTSVDVQSVLTHEFGHFVGLDHVTDRTHTMYASIPANSTIYRTLCDGDVAGIRVLYP